MGYTVYWNNKTGELVPVYDYDKTKIPTNDPAQVYTDDAGLLSKGFIPIRPGFRGKKLHRWRWGLETFKSRAHDVSVVETKNGMTLKFFQSGFNAPKNIISCGSGTKETTKIFDGDPIFENPKSTSLLSRLLSIGGDKELVALDFFSGSGTTAHAVMALNAQDGGNRKHISVQLDEPTDPKSEARKAGYKTIFEITRERIKRAAAKIRTDHPDATCDFGFKEFKTIPANEGQFAGYMDDAETMEDYTPFNGMALDDDGIQALLTTWAAYDGLPLNQSLDAVDLDGYTAFAGGDKLYFVNSGLNIKHIVTMLTRIDEDPTFTPRKIVVFHHRFNDKQLREFSEAVNAPNRKHLQLEFIQRF